MTDQQTADPAPAPKPISTARIVLRLAIYFPVLALTFFGTAGTVRWIEAWVFLLSQLCVSTYLIVWLKKNDPELLRERMTFLRKTGKKWDRWIVLGITILSIPYYLVPGLDAVRYQWSHVPLPVQGIGFIASVTGVTIIVMTMRVNTFLTPVIEIQRRRGHKVITTGPYAYVRHPMYVGVFLHILGLPLFLGSLYTVAIGAVFCVLLIVRTHFEDRTLHNELEGYREYAQRVRYRIFPGVW